MAPVAGKRPGPSSFGTDPHATAVPKRAIGTRVRRRDMAENAGSEPVGEKAHGAAADELPEGVLAVDAVEDVEPRGAHLDVVVEEAVAEARVDERVGVEMKRLVDDALLRDVDDLLGPVLGRHVVEVERAIRAGLRAHLHAGVTLVHGRTRIGGDEPLLLRGAARLVLADVHERVVGVDVEALDGEDADTELGAEDVVLLALCLEAA